MEVRSQRDKSQVSLGDSQTVEIRSIRLGKRQKSCKSLTSSCERLTTIDSSKLINSISRKLRPTTIDVFSKRSATYKTQPLSQRRNLAVSCFPALDIHHSEDGMRDYYHLKSKPAKLDSVIENIHSSIGDKRGCLEQNCPVKRKWLRRVQFYERQVKNARLFRQRIGQCRTEVEDQIQKDVTRTFPENVLTRTKINVQQSLTHGQKFNLVDTIRSVLKLYSIYDGEVGYVQGMNLICGAIALHTKEVTSCYVVFRELMVYNKLRQFYVDNFSLLNTELKDLFHHYLKHLNQPLYDFLIQTGVDHLMFLQYYVTIFASIVDIRYMHIVIDLFIRDGISFLHRFWLTLLLWLKETLMAEGEEDSVVMKMGATYLRGISINWQEIIANCLKLDIC